ncbi:MAG: hypothetical protein GF353_07115 [Candidatus Lokiarchaeota archaeon]|nr:hypothetical protein [Candidatus Lokiarchaeota archaeon]
MNSKIIGYHGTHSKNVDSIIKNGYRLSGEKEWFGRGVYFFQDYSSITNGFEEAKLWAINVKKFKKSAVLQSLIISTKYFDLVDNIEHRKYYDKLRKSLTELHKKSGKDIKDFHDHIIFNKLSEEDNIDFIRACVDAGRNYGYYSIVVRRLQVQICVRNSNCIKENKCIYKE